MAIIQIQAVRRVTEIACAMPGRTEPVVHTALWQVPPAAKAGPTITP